MVDSRSDSEPGCLLFTDEVLNKLRCYMCNGYLSCEPLRLSQEGKSICGKCTTEETLPQQFALEAVLKHAFFPCSYQEYGCLEYLVFGPNNHELVCHYRPLECPMKCSWKGSCTQFFVHFKNCHSECVPNARQFDIDFNIDQEGILMFQLDKVDFFIKYLYKSCTHELIYDIRYCTDAVGALCRLCVINYCDKNCYVNLKGHNCLQFNNVMFDSQNQDDSHTLDMKKIYEVLDKTTKFTIEINITLIKQNRDGWHMSSAPSAFNFQQRKDLQKRSLRLTKSLNSDSV